MRGTGALVVAAMLDFLTFALCAPYSETTDGKQFDVLLEKVADRGRTLYRLFQQPSHTIVKVKLEAEGIDQDMLAPDLFPHPPQTSRAR